MTLSVCPMIDPSCGVLASLAEKSSTATVIPCDGAVVGAVVGAAADALAWAITSKAHSAIAIAPQRCLMVSPQLDGFSLHGLVFPRGIGLRWPAKPVIADHR